VIGHGASSPRAVAASIETAAEAVTEGLVPGVRAALGDLVARRRAEAVAWPGQAGRDEGTPP
jgi:hypothetical protein